VGPPPGFQSRPEVLQELASKVGPKKRGPAGPAQMAAKTHGGLSGAYVCVARRRFRRASRVPAIFVAVFDGPKSVVLSGGGS
jgi:hypothetical protein